jgi:transposase, IS5 family
MRHADQVLEDEQLLNTISAALVRRHPKSRTRGRLGVPAEISSHAAAQAYCSLGLKV